MRRVLSGLVAALLVAGLSSAVFVGGSAETTGTHETSPTTEAAAAPPAPATTPAPPPTAAPSAAVATTAAPTTTPRVTTRRPPPTGLSVPSTIPADCSRAVDKELMSWIAGVPDGSTLLFATNGCYGIDNTMLIQDRRNLTLQGNGSTFKTLTRGDSQRRVWRVRGGDGIILTNMTVRGGLNCPYAISTCAWPAQPVNLEWQHAFAFEGTVNGTLDKVQAYDVWGDFVEANHDERICACDPAFGTPSKNIRVLNSRFERAGRMGIGITNIGGFLLQNSYLGEVNMSAIDLELDFSSATGRNIRILNNTFGRHRFAMFANEGQGVNERSVIIDGNTQVAGPYSCQPIVNSPGKPGARRTNYRITNNNFRVFGEFAWLTNMTGAVVANNTAVHIIGGGCGDAGVRLENSQQISVTDNVFTDYPRVILLVGTNNSGIIESGNRL